MSGTFAKPFMLRAAERVLLRRALRIYAKTYLALKAAAREQWEKEQHQSYIDAADALAERILKE